jgi:hypothetical protein
MPQKVQILDMAMYNSILTRASRESVQVLYTELHRMNYDVNLFQVYNALMSNNVKFVTRGNPPNGTLPNACEIWPHIHNPVLCYMGNAEMLVPFGELHSDHIWMAIELYIQQMRLHELWDEVLNSMATLFWRPEGDHAFCGHRKVTMALPRSQMQAAALGPALHGLRHWEEEGKPLMQPLLANIAWKATSRYMMWSLMYRDYTAAIGAAELRVLNDNSEFIKRCEWMVAGGISHTPLQAAVQNGAKAYGWDGLLGRILPSVKGIDGYGKPNGIKLRIRVPLQNRFVVQWEEALDCTSALPEGSAALSMLYPAKPVGTPDECSWVLPLNVINRYGISDALYSMYNVGWKKMAYIKHAAKMDMNMVVERKVLLNYRNAAADAQFFCCKTPEGTSVVPSIWVDSLGEAIGGVGAMHRLADSEWFISHNYEASDDTLLQLFRDLDSTLSKYWQDRMLDMWADEAQEEAEDEEEGSAERPASTEGPTQSKMVEETGKYEPFDLEVIDEIEAQYVEQPLWIGFIKSDLPEHGRQYRTLSSILASGVSGELAQLKPDADVVKVVRGLAVVLQDLMHTPGAARKFLEMDRLRQAFVNVGHAYELSGGITDFSKFVTLTGGNIPGDIQPHDFNKAIELGFTVQEILRMGPAEEVARAIELEAQKQEEILLSKQDSPVISSYKGEDIQTDVLPGPMQTREEVVKVEEIPPEAQEQDFTGGQPSVESGGKDQAQSSSAAAEGVVRTSPRLSTMEFQTPEVPRKD